MRRRFPGLLRLGLRQFAVYLLLAVPFVGATAGAVLVLWRGHDLNGLIVMKPPAFWGGVAAGGLLMAVYAVLAARLFLRWIVTLPILLLERDTSAIAAMRTSVERMRGRLATAATAVAMWAAIVLVGTALIAGLLGWFAGRMLTAAGTSLAVVVPMTAAVLLGQWLVAALLSVASAVSFAGLLLALYRECDGNVTLADEAAEEETPARRVPHRWTILAIALGALVLAGLSCYGLLTGVRVEEQIEITAHRAGALLAPENTVAAIRRAVEARADWAEIDVQLTADGALVVIHDYDLVRVAGSKLRVADSTLAEIRQIDVGRKFSAEFAGERVPTLDEVIAAAGEGHGVRLNIELKPHGPADVEPLVAGVLDAIRRGQIVDRCRVCSQSYESLQLAKQRRAGADHRLHRRRGVGRPVEAGRQLPDGRRPHGDARPGRAGRPAGHRHSRLDRERPRQARRRWSTAAWPTRSPTTPSRCASGSTKSATSRPPSGSCCGRGMCWPTSYHTFSLSGPAPGFSNGPGVGLAGSASCRNSRCRPSAASRRDSRRGGPESWPCPRARSSRGPFSTVARPRPRSGGDGPCRLPRHACEPGLLVRGVHKHDLFHELHLGIDPACTTGSASLAYGLAPW